MARKKLTQEEIEAREAAKNREKEKKESAKQQKNEYDEKNKFKRYVNGRGMITLNHNSNPEYDRRILEMVALSQEEYEEKYNGIMRYKALEAASVIRRQQRNKEVTEMRREIEKNPELVKEFNAKKTKIQEVSNGEFLKYGITTEEDFRAFLAIVDSVPIYPSEVGWFKKNARREWNLFLKLYGEYSTKSDEELQIESHKLEREYEYIKAHEELIGLGFMSDFNKLKENYKIEDLSSLVDQVEKLGVDFLNRKDQNKLANIRIDDDCREEFKRVSGSEAASYNRMKVIEEYRQGIARKLDLVHDVILYREQKDIESDNQETEISNKEGHTQGKDVTDAFLKELEVLKSLGVNTSKIRQRDTIETLVKRSKNVDIQQIQQAGLDLKKRIGLELTHIRAKNSGREYGRKSTEEQARRLFEEYGISVIPGQEDRSAAGSFLHKLEILKKLGVRTGMITQLDTIRTLANKTADIDLKMIEENGLDLDDGIGEQLVTLRKAYRGNGEKGKGTPPTAEQVKELREIYGVSLEMKKFRKKSIAKAAQSATAEECDEAKTIIGKIVEKNKDKIQSQSK